MIFQSRQKKSVREVIKTHLKGCALNSSAEQANVTSIKEKEKKERNEFLLFIISVL